jgi:hypothetical protein
LGKPRYALGQFLKVDGGDAYAGITAGVAEIVAVLDVRSLNEGEDRVVETYTETLKTAEEIGEVLEGFFYRVLLADGEVILLPEFVLDDIKVG